MAFSCKPLRHQRGNRRGKRQWALIIDIHFDLDQAVEQSVHQLTVRIC
jgi:hypothetical protein